MGTSTLIALPSHPETDQLTLLTTQTHPGPPKRLQLRRRRQQILHHRRQRRRRPRPLRRLPHRLQPINESLHPRRRGHRPRHAPPRQRPLPVRVRLQSVHGERGERARHRQDVHDAVLRTDGCGSQG